MIYLGLSMQANGQALAAEKLLLAEYESYSNKSDTYALFVLESLGFIYLNSGQLEQAKRIIQVLRQTSMNSSMGLMKNWADWFLGVICYQKNELEAAQQYFYQIFENRYNAQISPYRDAAAGLALTHQIRGEGLEALQIVDSLSQFDFELRGSEDNRTRSLRARLMLLQGDLETACRWVDSFTDPPPDQPLLWFEEPQVTRARILLAKGSDADLLSAQQILDVLNELTDRTHNKRYKIEILALRAMTFNAQRNTDAAYTELMHAIDLSKLGGFILFLSIWVTPCRRCCTGL